MSNFYVDFGFESPAANDVATLQQHVAIERQPQKPAEIDTPGEYALVGFVIGAMAAPIALSYYLRRNRQKQQQTDNSQLQ